MSVRSSRHEPICSPFPIGREGESGAVVSYTQETETDGEVIGFLRCFAEAEFFVSITRTEWDMKSLVGALISTVKLNYRLCYKRRAIVSVFDL
jgi:hypothetical protein